MSNIVGPWKMTQSFEMTPFTIEFFPDGTLIVEGGFFGTWTFSPDSGQISMAICPNGTAPDFGGQTITSYWGTVINDHNHEPLSVAMSGLATGAKVGAIHSGVQGYWVAIRLPLNNK